MNKLLDNICLALKRFDNDTGFILAKEIFEDKGFDFYYQIIHPKDPYYVITTYDYDKLLKKIECYSVDIIIKTNEGFDVIYKDQLFCKAGLLNTYHLDQPGDSFRLFSLPNDCIISELPEHQKYPLLTYSTIIEDMLKAPDGTNPSLETIEYLNNIKTNSR